jgi:hypothetical protein
MHQGKKITFVSLSPITQLHSPSFVCYSVFWVFVCLIFLKATSSNLNLFLVPFAFSFLVSVSLALLNALPRQSTSLHNLKVLTNERRADCFFVVVFFFFSAFIREL